GDDEKGPFRGSVAWPVDPIVSRDRALRLEIREQRKAELARFGEGRMAPATVDRDAKQGRTEPLELVQDLVVERHLVAADRAPVGRIERQYGGLAEVVRQRDPSVLPAFEKEKRSAAADRGRAGCR